MLSQGVTQGVITQAQADQFEMVHAAMDEVALTTDLDRVGGMDRMRDLLLEELLEHGRITQSEADTFTDVHDRLVEAGLMQ
jgi:hypothetical protein